VKRTFDLDKYVTSFPAFGIGSDGNPIRVSNTAFSTYDSNYLNKLRVGRVFFNPPDHKWFVIENKIPNHDKNEDKDKDKLK
jgi:hypothetical protein